jgi:uncharacterized protein (TIGR03083 family)
MSESADRTIAALRANHDRLAQEVDRLSPEQLSDASGAVDWSVAQVLSHLGSSAEIWMPPLEAAISGTEAPEADNQSVWDRWNALEPGDQAAGFLEQDERFLATLEGLDADQRRTIEIDLGFMPAPAPLATFLAMRLNETTLHGWDVLVAHDPDASLDAETAEVLLDHFTDSVGFMLGFIGKADALAEPATVAVDGHVILIEDAVSLASGSDHEPTATFVGPTESVVRLLAGRLTPEHTPDAVEVTGNVTLDDLRRVFPGY